MAFNDKGSKPKVIIGIIIVVFLICVITILVMGVRGIFKIIGTVASLSIIALALFCLAWLFWYIFLRKERYDVTYVNKKRLIEAGKINNQKGLLGDLYLSGDAGHSRIRLGKIQGYCRIQILKRTNIFDEKKQPLMEKDKETGEMKPKYTLDNEEQDVFTVKKGLIGDPLVIRVSPEDHDALVGDVTLKGFSILPHSEYWFLNKDFLDVRKIDFAILKEAQRGIMFENLRDMKTIVDKSIGLDSTHQKDIERKNLVEIPEQIPK